MDFWIYFHLKTFLVIRDSIIRMCKEYLQKEAQTLRSSKEAKDFASQFENMLGSKNMVRKI